MLIFAYDLSRIVVRTQWNLIYEAFSWTAYEKFCQLWCCFIYKRNSLREEIDTLAHGFRDISSWTAVLAPLFLCLSKQKCHGSWAELLALQLPDIREGRRKGIGIRCSPENRTPSIPLAPVSRYLKHFPKVIIFRIIHWLGHISYAPNQLSVYRISQTSALALIKLLPQLSVYFLKSYLVYIVFWLYVL